MALYGLTAFMKARGETPSAFAVDVAVNGAAVKTVTFDAASLTAPDPVLVSVGGARGRQHRHADQAWRRRALLVGRCQVLRHPHADRAHRGPPAGHRAGVLHALLTYRAEPHRLQRDAVFRHGRAWRRGARAADGGRRRATGGTSSSRIPCRPARRPSPTTACIRSRSAGCGRGADARSSATTAPCSSRTVARWARRVLVPAEDRHARHVPRDACAGHADVRP